LAEAVGIGFRLLLDPHRASVVMGEEHQPSPSREPAH
jgi:hypothetical protein